MAGPYVASTGTYTGNQTARSITLGYRPAFVMGFNQTDGDTAWGHIDGMTDATAIAFTSAVAADTNACTITATGFDLGTSAVINETAKVYWYVAFHN